jgi:hypothetical protein
MSIQLENLSGDVALLAHETELCVSVSVSVSLCQHCSDDTIYMILHFQVSANCGKPKKRRKEMREKK